MNIEASANRPTPAAPHRGDASRGPVGSRADAAAADSGAISFLSLLGASLLPMADATLPAGPTSALAPADLSQGPGAAPTEAQTPSDGLPLELAWLVASGTAGAVPTAPGSAMLAASPAAMTGARGGPPAGAAAASGALTGAATLSEGNGVRVAQTDGWVSIADGAGAKGGATGALAAGAAVSGQPDDGNTGSPRDFMARVEAARVAADADATTAVRGTAASVNGMQLKETSLFDAAAAGVRSSTPWRASERSAHRSGRLTDASTVPGAQGAMPGTSQGASPVYAPGATTPVPAAAVADKVYYWMSRGVQNAQLQLEAFDGGSVDVSISVKGQQAQVEFRTDMPDARRLLLDAMPQLKDMLEAEGMVLSGGFVGHSEQRESGSGGRNPQGQGSRGSLMRVAESVSAQASPVRGEGGAGGAIDLFV